DDRPARVRIPVRRAESGKRGDEVHAAVVRDAQRERLDVCRGANETEAVANPLHDGAADEHAPLEGVFSAPADLPRDGGYQLLARGNRARPDVLQKEATGAVRVFRHARRPAHLTEERGLLIAGDSGDRYAAQRLRRRDLTERFA